MLDSVATMLKLLKSLLKYTKTLLFTDGKILTLNLVQLSF